jgi:hypothetical protein
MHYGGGGPSVKQLVNCHFQVFVADLISGAGHSLRLHQTPPEDQCFPRSMGDGKQ